MLGLIGRFFHLDTEAIARSLEKLPVLLSVIAFVGLYVIVTFFIWLSKDIFRFVAALLFGPYLSTLLVWSAETINAFILFHLARNLGRDFVQNYLKGSLKDLDEKLTQTNFFWLFMFRAVPLMPFRFLDLGVGLTKIPFKKYLPAVVLGSPLRIFWLQYVLAGVGKSIFNNPYALSEYLLSNKVLFIFSLAYVGLVILVAWKIKIKEKI